MANTGQLSRHEKLSLIKQRSKPWDMVVVGGGITGAGVALMAARAGLDVLLLEKQDYAWGTSSRSSKMVHGGLRYLSQGEFRLARESVRERERLMKEAPGLIEPMSYLFPFREKQFPTRRAFSVLLNIYGYFARKRDHKYLDRDQTIAALPGLNEHGLLGSAQYTDALTDDSRLVLRVLADASRSDATTLNYAAVKMIHSDGAGSKLLEVQDQETSEVFAISTKTVINATGVWADDLREQLGQTKRIRPLRGSHIVVPSWRMPVHQCLTYLHPQDKRGVFIYPWQGRTVIGTTDLDHSEDLDQEAAIKPEEVAYLLAGANHNFPGTKLTEKDVISTWSGVRPIVGNEGVDPKELHPSKAKRDHVVWDDDGTITVTGGKLTTFRVMAEQVLETCATYLEGKNTARAGDYVFEPQQSTLDDKASRDLPEAELKRLQGYYGADLPTLIAAMSPNGLSFISGTNRIWAELEWAVMHEEVVHLDDLLLRRTRIGLVLEEGGAALAGELETRLRDKLGWSMDKWQDEWSRYRKIWRDHYSLPSTCTSQEQEMMHEVTAG
ncbi:MULTISPECIES: glycerol-3-phosphate dehydrogenase/oxidase [unclassified Pseudovibrio]|uniref:glycerol-3-phosphate dehydrogenase/oxidase n=1 Tax=unclassified Pseudovibrio TaxID=2627060 RepID=UPI0007AE5A2E|nr:MULTISPECIES: glycerol-3-phosphate dehydrogenase/oxidase [unclassified Pseudovibrio]KZK91255.1 Aerobic glycerol-3-phosphate dehydrogenase [Pseudovibrio sp. Ad46]KZL13876.1 Aerobic glycerol-3-phosphate dehydrogenase [Pseudovibrio sp. Ad26]